MKNSWIFLLIFGIFITTIFTLPVVAVAESYSVIIPQGANNRLCATFHNCYSPENITIFAGDSITWINDDSDFHSVTSGAPGAIDEKFDSELFSSGESWTLTFDNSGKYDYFCTIHPWMVGTVLVNKSNESEEQIPEWVKDIAKWWSLNQLSDSEFAKSIEYLIEKEIIIIPETSQGESTESKIPSWLKKNAGWWSQGLLPDDEFLKSIQFLITTGIISL